MSLDSTMLPLRKLAAVEDYVSKFLMEVDLSIISLLKK
jgi:hypothetical protein